MKEQRRKMKAKLCQFELQTSNIARAQIANDDSQNTQNIQKTPITLTTPTTPTTPTKKNATGQTSDGIHYLFWI